MSQLRAAPGPSVPQFRSGPWGPRNCSVFVGRLLGADDEEDDEDAEDEEAVGSPDSAELMPEKALRIPAASELAAALAAAVLAAAVLAAALGAA